MDTRSLIFSGGAVVLVAGLTALAFIVADDDAPDPHAGHDMAAIVAATHPACMLATNADHSSMGAVSGNQGPSSIAFAAANATMHAGMDISYSGNVDVDFLCGMIPHHQGAIDMARVLLVYTNDPQLRGLAEGIIDAQTQEIAFMRDQLDRYLATGGSQ